MRGGGLWAWQQQFRHKRYGAGDMGTRAFHDFPPQTFLYNKLAEQGKQNGKWEKKVAGGKKHGGGGVKHGSKRGKGGGGLRFTPAERELQSAILKCTASQEVLATLQQTLDRDESVINHVHVATALHRVAKFSKRSRGLRLDKVPTFMR